MHTLIYWDEMVHCTAVQVIYDCGLNMASVTHVSDTGSACAP